MKKLFLVGIIFLTVSCPVICFGENDLATMQDNFSASQDCAAAAQDNPTIVQDKLTAMQDNIATDEIMAGNDTFIIINKSKKDVFVYDWDMSLTSAVSIVPVNGGNPLKATQTLYLPMQGVANKHANAGRRVYISDKHLSKSLERKDDGKLHPALPDPFCPWYDGGIMFSFFEYFYEPPVYTVDLSHIDVLSYPLTILFDQDVKNSCVRNFEYGFREFSKAVIALKNHRDYCWGKLVWPKDNPGKDWPEGIYRIIGPNLVWTSESCGGLSSYAPDVYKSFIQSLPYNGCQLFKNKQNLDGWKNLTLTDSPSPSNTGYVKALHEVSNSHKVHIGNQDIDKYGYFTYCRDNKSGEFTYVPLNVYSTITIYPYNE
jgi:hypothetical protein